MFHVSRAACKEVLFRQTRSAVTSRVELVLLRVHVIIRV